MRNLLSRFSFRIRMGIVVSFVALACALAEVYIYLTHGLAWLDLIILFPASIAIGAHYFYIQRYELSLRIRFIAAIVAIAVILGGFGIIALFASYP
jgi:uncharacterized membrane protein YjjP (DUF1212 family)